MFIILADNLPVMKKCSFILLAICLSITAGAQKFDKQQQAQAHAIKAAQRKHRITALEYRKLMKEQYVIQETIAKAAYDGVWTAHEKNMVAGKLERAEKRLRRYKTNGEVY